MVSEEDIIQERLRRTEVESKISNIYGRLKKVEDVAKPATTKIDTQVKKTSYIGTAKKE